MGRAARKRGEHRLRGGDRALGPTEKATKTWVNKNPFNVPLSPHSTVFIGE